MRSALPSDSAPWASPSDPAAVRTRQAAAASEGGHRPPNCLLSAPWLDMQRPPLPLPTPPHGAASSGAPLFIDKMTGRRYKSHAELYGNWLPSIQKKLYLEI